MFVFVLPVFAVSVYLCVWNAGCHRRNTQTWDALLSRLRPNWSISADGNYSLWREGLRATPDDAWQRIDGAKGLNVMYQNAGVMLEMAHYAARTSMMADRQLLAALAQDAMHIRVYVLIALSQLALTRANDNVRMYAYQSVTLYTEMAGRMVQLLQAEAAGIVPDFVAAL